MNKNIIVILTILLSSVVALSSLFHPGIFTSHDIWHQVARLYWYTKALQDGQFPPYWIANLGNEVGYPLFFFSYHLPWLVAQPIILLGINIFDTLKLLFFLSYFFSGVFMYFLVYHITKLRLSGLASSILYLWVPYHFLNIFVFGSIGGSFVFMFLPLSLLGFYKLGLQKRVGIILTALGFSGIVLSHMITFFSLAPLFASFILLQVINSKNRILYSKNLLLGFLLGVGLSSFYLQPATFYKSFTQISSGAFNNLYENNFLPFKDLIYSRWGFGTNNFSVQIGVIHWLIMFLSLLIILFSFYSKKIKFVNYFFFLTPIFFLNLFLMTEISKPVWDIMTNFIVLDFPAVFLLSSVFIPSFLFGLIIANLQTKAKILIFCFFTFAVLYTNRNHLNVNQYTNYSLNDYIGAETTTNSYHEYFPLNASLSLLEINQNYLTVPGAETKNRILKTNGVSFLINSEINQEFSIKQVVFPGIKVFIDDKESTYKSDSLGRVLVKVEEGQHKVSVSFKETPIIKLSKLLTLISVIIVLFLCVKLYEKK